MAAHPIILSFSFSLKALSPLCPFHPPCMAHTNSIYIQLYHCASPCNSHILEYTVKLCMALLLAPVPKYWRGVRVFDISTSLIKCLELTTCIFMLVLSVFCSPSSAIPSISSSSFDLLMSAVSYISSTCLGPVVVCLYRYCPVPKSHTITIVSISPYPIEQWHVTQSNFTSSKVCSVFCSQKRIVVNAQYSDNTITKTRSTHQYSISSHQWYSCQG